MIFLVRQKNDSRENGKGGIRGRSASKFSRSLKRKGVESRRFELEERVESAERQPSPGNLRSPGAGAPEHEGVSA